MATIIDTLTTKFNFMVDNTGLSGLRSSLDSTTASTKRLAVGTMEAEAAEREAGVASEFFAEKLTELKGIIGSFFGAFLGFEVISKSVEKFAELDNALGQIDAALISTGNAVGYTKDQLAEMADEFGKTSIYDKGDILSGVTQSLLKFTSVHGETFKRAQQDIVDYASRMNIGLREATQSIGKALDDPTKAIGVLRKAGVTLGDDQQKLFEEMVKGGHAAEAQAKILGLLENRFKGAAEAASKTGLGPLKQFSNRLVDIMEKIGELVLTALNPLIGALNKLFDFIEEHMTFIKIFAVALGTLATVIYGVAAAERVWAIANAFLASTLWAALAPILALVIGAAALGLIIEDLWTYFHGGDSAIGRVIGSFNKMLEQYPRVQAGLRLLGAVFKLVFTEIKQTVEILYQGIMTFVNGIVAAFKYIVDTISNLPKYIKDVKMIMGIKDDSDKDGAKGPEKKGDKVVSFFDNITNKVNAETSYANASGAQFRGETMAPKVIHKTIAPVITNNVTVNTTGGNPHEIGQHVHQVLQQNIKHVARAADSDIAV